MGRHHQLQQLLRVRERQERPSSNSGKFVAAPWKVTIDGECMRTGVMDLEDILKVRPRGTRLPPPLRRSVVDGDPVGRVPAREPDQEVEPTSKAKYVEFTSIADSKMMPGVRYPILNWPYREGLRLDEAMHPLTLMVVGLYDEVLPAQDGAPLRLAVPWKYGFKHAKSMVRIRFSEKQPANSWRELAASEYGFYANVNPTVDHPRWSQATERRIGEFSRRKTLMFNGYADQVQSLYAGWICGGTTDVRPLPAAWREAVGLCCGAGADRLAPVGGAHRTPEREPAERHDQRNGRLGHSIRVHHPGDHADCWITGWNALPKFRRLSVSTPSSTRPSISSRMSLSTGSPVWISRMASFRGRPRRRSYGRLVRTSTSGRSSGLASRRG